MSMAADFEVVALGRLETKAPLKKVELAKPFALAVVVRTKLA